MGTSSYQAILELDPEDVGEEEEDLVLGVVVRRDRDVAVDTADLLSLAWRITACSCFKINVVDRHSIRTHPQAFLRGGHL